MKLWLKKLTSAVTVFTLSASVVAVNATAVKAEDSDLGYFNGQPIVSITNLTAEKQEDAANAEEKALLALTGGDTVTAIVELEKACVIDAGLKPGTPEGKAYASELKVEQETVNNTIKSTYAELIEKGNKTSGLKKEVPALNVTQSYVNVMNGFAVEVPYKALPLIREMKGVKNVFVSREYELPETEVEPEMYTSTSMISSDIANQSGFSGEGTVVGVLDTGLDVAHEAFANAPADAKITEAIDGTYLNATGTTYFSEKVPFAYDYADKDNDVYPLRSNHGNHVAGTVAGKTVDAEGNVTFSGVAPEAQLAIFKVFSEKQNGARDEWILAALEDVVVIQPDVINLSLGSPAGFSSDLYTGETTMEDVYNRVYQNGTVLAISAGNEYYMGSNHMDGSGMADAENPNTGIVGSPSTYSGPTSVASIENYQLITDYFVVDDHTIMYSDTADSEEQMFSSLGDQAPLSYVLVPGYGEAADYEGLDVTGKVAVVSRGSTTFVSKQLTAAEMGAVAIIIYNNQPGTISMQIEKNTIPAIAITLADAQYLINSETMEIAELGHAGKFVNDQGWQMSGFSSWGVTEDLKLKPEVTAPGGHIYSALPGNTYGDMSGTSMAAPHMAGLTALATQWVDKLYKNRLNELQKADIANALIMSTATPVPYGDSEDLFYSPRKQGAGLIDIANTISSLAYLTVDGTTGNRPKIELGDDPAKSGFYRLSFTVNNWSEFNLGYSVKVYVQSDEVVDGKITTAPVALDAIVEGEETVAVGPGASRRINLAVTLTDSAKEYLDSNYPNGGFVDGFVVLEADGAELNEEGIANFVDLSIPFVGFYGNWDDAPLLDETLENVENAKIAGTGASTVFGYLNYYQATQGLVWPFIGQNAYDPEWDYFAKNVPAQHNTISSDSYYRIYVDYLGPSYLPYLAEDDEKNTGIWYLTPALLRNVTWWSVDIKDADTGEAYYHDEYSENLGKYYDRADGVISGGMIYLGWGAYNQYSDTYEALPEGTNIELTLNVARDQNSRVESQKMYFTIDNSEPEIVGYEDGNTPVQVYELADGSRYLIFTARDNYFLADYEVYDEEDNLIGFDYFDDEEAGTENLGFADITDYDEDAEFTIVLHDYTEYEAKYNISATADMVITPDKKSAAVGSDVSFTLSDTNGFEIDEAEAEWTVEGAESESTKIEAGVLTISEDETASTLTVKALYGEMEAAAVVTVLHYYNVELIVGEGGTAELSESGKVLETTNVIVTATPDDTHILDQILVNGEPVEADSSGKASFIVEGDTTVEVTFKEYPDLIINELTYTAPVVLGYESVLTAVTEGGKAPYEYKFTVKTDNGWVTAQDFSSDAEWHWTPEQFGDVRVAVYVKDARGVQAKKLFYVPVDETLPPVTLEIDAPKTVEIGETVTITGTGSGGAKPLQYKLSRKDGDTWVTVENYSEKNEFSWTPETVGSYRFAVYVKDAENTQVKKLVTIKVVEPLTLSVEIPSAAVVGEPVSIKGIGSGGTEPLQYKMALKDGDTWTTFSDYTDSGEFTWTPEAAGTYRIAVYVKDADNVQKKELHKITVTEAN